MASPKPFDGKLKPFLGEPKCEIKERVIKGQRLPNIVVTKKGTVLATWGWGSVQAVRSEDGGETWGKPIKFCKGLNSGGTIVDEGTGDILAFSEANHPPAPKTAYRSKDDGKTWEVIDMEIKPDKNGYELDMCMNEHGITLTRGKHAGRLIKPARTYAGRNSSKLYPKHYTSALYSDDGGKTWVPSDPFPEFGTGEATLAELSDGTIYYNSRRHWAPEGKNPRRRWHGWSKDGGQTWKDVEMVEVLPDGPQHSNYGLMGGLTRLPVKGMDILVFSNIDPPQDAKGNKAAGRHHGTMWASFDGGKTWPVKRLLQEGGFAYSSVYAGRPGTPSEGWIYVGYEVGKQGLDVARFNLSWLIDVGEGKAVLTGDGKIPIKL